MKLESPSVLCARGATAWQRDKVSGNRLVLLHTLPALLLPLLVVVVNYFLDRELAGTGGIAGIGLRSSLETTKWVLSLAVQALLPFWEIGLLFVAMGIGRNQQRDTASLFEGFRRWGALLRMNLFRALRYIVEILSGMFFGSVIFMFTPFYDKLVGRIDQITQTPALENATAEELTEALMQSLRPVDILPFYIFCVLAIGVLLIPVFYRYRLADYLLLDSDSPKAMSALRESVFAMRGNCFALFRLDLQLFWYYLLIALSVVAAYADLWLPALGVALPFDESIAALLAATLQAVVLFVTYYLFRGRVETTYACAYQSLIQGEGSEDPC